MRMQPIRIILTFLTLLSLLPVTAIAEQSSYKG